MREGYKKTEIGVIPKDWEVYKFFDVINKIIDFRGRTPKKLGLDWGDGDILALSANNVKMGKIDFEIENYFASNQLYEKWMSGNELCKNDILMTMEAPLGNVALVPDNNKYILSQRVVALKTKGIIDNKFMLYMLMSDMIQNQFNMLSTGTTAKGINQKNLAKVKVVVPSLKEQEKIAEILSSVDSQIDDTEKLIEKAKELKKGLMQKLLTKGIGHSEFKKTEVGEIPVEWEVYRFFDIIEKIIDFRGRTPKKLGLDWGNGDILALSANNVKMGKIDFEIENYFGSDELYEKWMSGNELCKNDVLMTMEAPLGNVALVPDDNKYILSQRVVALKTKDMIDNRFMLYMLMSDIIQNQLNMLSTGTTAKGINQKNLAKVKVIVPPLKEQIKIAVILSSIDNKIEEYENKKRKLEELKKGLMQILLIGKRRLI